MSRARILTVAAGVAIGSTLLVAPAHAAPAKAQDRVECTNLSNGQLCISLNTSPSRVEIIYIKKSGSQIKAKLGYRTSNGGGSTFGPTETISTGDREVETWTMSYRCDVDWKGLIKVEGQGTFETPWATC